MNGLDHPTFKPAPHIADEFSSENLLRSQIYAGVIQRQQYAMHFPVSTVPNKPEPSGHSESLNSESQLESEP
jgi:hypothetical protein